MAVSAEMILKPKIDENQMREEAKKQERVMKNAADQMEDDLKKGVENGLKDGAEAGNRIVITKFKLAAATLALAAAALIKDTFDKVTGGAKEVEMDLRDRISSIQDITSTAKGLGVDRATYAGFTLAGQAQGIEQDDMRGIFETFVGALNRPEMANYKEAAENKGIEKSFLDFMVTLSQMDPEKAIVLNDEVMGGDALRASKFMEPIRKILESGGDLTTENILNTMMGGNLNLAGLRKAFNLSDPNINKVMRDDAERNQNTLLKGVNAEQAGDIKRIGDAEENLRDAQESVFSWKVDRFVVETEMTVKQINAAKIVSEGISDTYNLFFGEEARKKFQDKQLEHYDTTINPQTGKPLVTYGMIQEKGIVGQQNPSVPFSYIGSHSNNAGAKSLVEEALEASRHNQKRNDLGNLK